LGWYNYEVLKIIEMDVEKFTRELELEFEEVVPGTLTPNTNYREIEGWSSMHVLVVIAFVDSQFDIILSGGELQQTSSIADLYSIIQEKIK
jgi:acyl carrier protein